MDDIPAESTLQSDTEEASYESAEDTTSDLSVFDTLGGREEITFSLAE